MPIYKGQTKIVKLYKGTTQIIKRYKGTDLIYSASRLPSAYQEVEYIESTGEQWIDTGYAFNWDCSYYLKISAPIYWRSIIGTSQWGGTLIRHSSGIYRYHNSSISSINNSCNADSLLIQCSLNHLIINEENGTQQSDSGIDYTGNIIIFNTVSSYPRGAFKLYSCKIYDNNVLVRDFVPCYRKSDTEIGLYDIVNDVFYTNAGTGTFTKGPDV